MIDVAEIEDYYTIYDLDYRFHFDPDLKVLYVASPKTGCTTISTMLGVAWGVFNRKLVKGQWVASGHAHDRWWDSARHWSDLSSSEKHRLVNSPEVYRFTSIRNPFGRAVSVYLDKFVVNKPVDYHNEALFGSKEASPSFMEMLSRIQKMRIAGFFDDMQWRNLYRLTRPDLLNYNRIVRFESFSEDVLAVTRETGLPSTIPQTLFAMNATQKVKNYVGPVERAVLLSLYSEDFDHFSYRSDCLP